ncbi:MAG: regulatory iron-sulfur-containing complex subunit RicT [Chitinophagaceae bacterium]
MGCGHCGTSSKGTLPTGCKDHGSCRSGGCNRLNVHDWLSLVPVADFSKPFPFIEVSFNHGSRKDYYKTNTPYLFEKGDYVTLDSGSGSWDVGVVSLTGELVKLQMKKKGVKETSEELKAVLHKSTEEEVNRMLEAKKLEKDMMIRSRVIARSLNLDMKIAEVEMQADGKKATFFYTAEDRVDFRELIKQYAGEFRVKIEMRQIGIRQEAAKVGGIGSCGRELCCSTWLNEFKSVSTTAARYQNLSINQTKLSGQCGRLKCCLNYELDTYMDALRVFPDHADKLKMKDGTAYLQKRDIFKNLMWYSFERSNKLYPLTIERVNEIVELNKKGVFPDELQAVEVVKKSAPAEKNDYVDVVGQFSLKSLERAGKKKKQKERDKRQGGPQTANPAGPKTQANQGPRPPRPEQSGNKPAQGAGGNKPQGQGQNPNRPQGNAPRPQGNQGPKPQGNQGPRPQGNQGPKQGPRPQQAQGPRPPRPEQSGDGKQRPPGGKMPKNQGPKPQGEQGTKPPSGEAV